MPFVDIACQFRSDRKVWSSHLRVRFDENTIEEYVMVQLFEEGDMLYVEYYDTDSPQGLWKITIQIPLIR